MYPNKYENEVAAIGTVRNMNPIERVEAQIKDLKARLTDMEELKEILTTEPKLSRALELMASREIY